MGRSISNETMLRKPVLMLPIMIAGVDKIAAGRKVSIAKVVQEATPHLFLPKKGSDVHRRPAGSAAKAADRYFRVRRSRGCSRSHP